VGQGKSDGGWERPVNVLAGCHSRVRPWTREPLLHFAAIGLALFVVSRTSVAGRLLR